jgi:hypothetical protein
MSGHSRCPKSKRPRQGGQGRLWRIHHETASWVDHPLNTTSCGAFPTEIISSATLVARVEQKARRCPHRTPVHINAVSL